MNTSNDNTFWNGFSRAIWILFPILLMIFLAGKASAAV